MTAAPPRALYAAGLLTALTGALLVAWFVSGWADVRGRQRAVRDAPRIAAEQRGAELAHELRGELGAIMAREVERPYFQYQNLFHDPLASAGPSVAPSPLAHGPDDALVLGYFQLDARGRTTTPTINDDLPELSEPTRLADHRRFRDEVTRSLAAALAPPRAAGPLVAELAPAPIKPDPAQRVPRGQPRSASSAEPPVRVQAQQAEPAQNEQPAQANDQAQVQDRAVAREQLQAQDQAHVARAPQPQTKQQAQIVTLDRDSYLQNNWSNTVYENQRRSPPPQVVAPPQPIAITVSPLEWRTLAYAGQPAIVAVRQVETPDGRLAQGFVIDRTALTGWLATHAGDAVAELRTGDNGTTEIVPGWHLEVAANPRAVAAAAGDATSVARGFVLRFIAVGLVAILVALLVVMLVVRAERLARERSQFAAAAAHELRTPLAGLQLYGDMLADGLGDPSKLRDYARRMSEEASRLGRVVSNVLGFSQLERGNLSVDARPGALGDALCELAERAQPALDRAGAVLALEVAPELSATFDRDALARIVGNLLDNAEKYGRESGDRTITLAAREAGPTVEVVVSDRGPGIAPPARARLFQPFARGAPGDGPAGLGLGLALSQSLARAMGGELAYRPVPDGGAAFVLTLARG